MKSWAVLLLLAVGGVRSGEVAEEPSNVKDTIVIQTKLQNYEKPSLRDYKECQSNRQGCLDICAGSEKCELECPLCPELTEEPLLVHGINDTSYVAPAQPPLNTTNIIKLTNEITNIIKNDIKGRNEINVQVHQNVSTVGGRFGLGYNEQGSCCYVVQRERSCEHQERCQEHSRHRVCGARCRARVMHAKRVLQCEKDAPEECHETVQYVPMQRRKSTQRDSYPYLPKYQPQRQSQGCAYTNGWPYVSCGQNSNSARRSICQKCHHMAYGYVLQNGIPLECMGCFSSYTLPLMPQPVIYPPYFGSRFDYNYQPRPEQQPDEEDQYTSPQQEWEEEHDDLDIEDGDRDSGWVLKSEKCMDPSGELVNCKDGQLPPAHLEQVNDPYYDVPVQRRRRRHDKFIRSLYSRRV
ncbi:hypothetical protein AWZ03_013902 [Drosophila navojoa]|uniref:Uncharacterized protein n=1 Tax=Drosophila navojoa TaxID=7232 RepID=A0A484ASM5_DRONA|nr:uncharacterized protein LOC108649931 [Drosophila navojoa]TDG39677.1 hypothetical protein AWZ03_013902 [Drosophila navojoa]